jgi:hypothetical protein
MGGTGAGKTPCPLLAIRKKYMRSSKNINFVVDFPHFPAVLVAMCRRKDIFGKNNFLTEKNGVDILP